MRYVLILVPSLLAYSAHVFAGPPQVPKEAARLNPAQQQTPILQAEERHIQVQADLEPKAHLSLDEALIRFRGQGFDLLLADAEVALAEADVYAAKAIPNPVISGGAIKTVGAYEPKQCGAGGGCSTWGFNAGLGDQAALENLLSNKRGLKKAIAQQALKVAKHQRADAQRTLEYMVKLQFLTVALDQARLHFVEDLSASYMQSTQLFSARYEAGDVSEADLFRVEVDGLDAAQQVTLAASQLSDDTAQLAYLLGQRDSHAEPITVAAPWLEMVDGHPSTAHTEQDFIALAFQHRPDLLAQQKEVARMNLAATLSRRLRLPDMMLGLSYQQEGTGQQAIQPPTFSLGLSFALPLFYQQQGEVARAQVMHGVQQIVLHRLEAQVLSEVRRAHQALGYATVRMGRARNQLAPRASQALKLVQLQYAKGAASLLDLLDARRTALAVKQEYFDSLGTFWTAKLTLEQAVATEVRL